MTTCTVLYRCTADPAGCLGVRKGHRRPYDCTHSPTLVPRGPGNAQTMGPPVAATKKAALSHRRVPVRIEAERLARHNTVEEPLRPHHHHAWLGLGFGSGSGSGFGSCSARRTEATLSLPASRCSWRLRAWSAAALPGNGSEHAPHSWLLCSSTAAAARPAPSQGWGWGWG